MNLYIHNLGSYIIISSGNNSLKCRFYTLLYLWTETLLYTVHSWCTDVSQRAKYSIVMHCLACDTIIILAQYATTVALKWNNHDVPVVQTVHLLELFPLSTFSCYPRNKWRSYSHWIGRQLPRWACGGRGLLHNTASVYQQLAPGRPPVAHHSVRWGGWPPGINAGLFPRSSHAILR